MAADETVQRSNIRSESPLVSVLVSTRNHCRMLGRTVEAVMGQDLDAEIEMIVVDNASTDDTRAVMTGALDRATKQLTYARMEEDRGPSGGRNFALALARGKFIAFTDSDCTPDPGWLRTALQAFDSPDVGIVQGRTEAASQSPPLFSHFIETVELDGSFSTSNVVYRRDAIGDRGFDAACIYWEDVDLGWRVLAAGWGARFAGEAVVRHEVIPLTARQWILWPWRFANWPAKAAAYPGFRRHLFLRVWVSPMHFWFDLAVAAAIIAPWQPFALLLGVPYVIAFARTRSLRGKFPPAKLVAHVAWDCVALAALVAGSIRYRTLVL